MRRASSSFGAALSALATALSALAAALICVGTLACEDAPGRPKRADAYERPADVASFAPLYATNCSGCHGADGTHGAALALANPEYLAWAPHDAIRTVVANGVDDTPMPAFARSEGGWLTDEQIEILVEGLSTAWGAERALGPPELPPYPQRGGDANRGERVYAEFCTRCHGADGRGDADGSAITNADYLALVSDQSLRAVVVAGRPDLEMPGFWDVGDAPMTAEQISDVVAWLAARREQ